MKVYHIIYANATIEIMAKSLTKAMALIPENYRTREILDIKSCQDYNEASEQIEDLWINEWQAKFMELLH